ncbi:MAG: hypothetical protein JNM33_07970 [Rubrivivax sp.]|nr:hypothetical protein [Rubrivivax sp.]
MKSCLRLTVLMFTAALSLSTQAADAVTDAVQLAYAPYRAALFRTNGKSQAEAQQALAQARQAWAGVVERFALKPPPPYDRDADFAATLGQVSAVYDKAAGEIDAGKLREAHETLEAARDLMAALRQRNGVVVFSDAMNAYHAEMEHLLVRGQQLLAGPQGLHRLAAQSGVLDYLARQLRAQAPAALLRNADFEALLKEVEASAQNLKKAALDQDATALQAAMSKLKPAYSRLFLKFG